MMRTSLLLAAAIGLLGYPDCHAQERPSGLRPEAGIEAPVMRLGVGLEWR